MRVNGVLSGKMTPGDQASSREKGPHFQQGGVGEAAQLQPAGPHHSLPGQVCSRTLPLDLCTRSTGPLGRLAACCKCPGSPLGWPGHQADAPLAAASCQTTTLSQGLNRICREVQDCTLRVCVAYVYTAQFRIL